MLLTRFRHGWVAILLLCCIRTVEGYRPPRVRPQRIASANSPGIIKRTLADGTDEAESRLATQQRRREEALQDPTLLTKISFSERPDIHPSVKRALTEGMGLQAMTQVQAKTYGPAILGQSICASSRTGTGKTLAFLLPTIERLLERDLDLYRPGRSIGMVILVPTRELAIQIADQAESLLSYHRSNFSKDKMDVACIYGGVKMQRDMRLLSGQQYSQQQSRLPAILVSTPGRLLEHLEGNTRIHHRKFTDLVNEAKIVVFDETDLLFANHKHETKKILPFLARSEKRQTLLFSATFPRSLRLLLKDSIMKGADFVQVDCIDGDELDTNPENLPTSGATVVAKSIDQRVEQSYVSLVSMSQYIPTLLALLRREQQTRPNDYKLLVFFPASRLVRFFFQFFSIGNLLKSNSNVNPENVWEIHSRMSQSSRTKASNAFRGAKKGILFSSDVSARGLDYPDVSLVVQFGAPLKDNDYIHRLGRTGRAGQRGRGLLILMPFEKDQRRLRHLLEANGAGTMQEDTELASWLERDDDQSSDDMSGIQSLVLKECRYDLEATRFKVRSGHVVLTPSAEAAYKAFLAYYIGATKNGTASRKVGPSEILRYAEEFAVATGLSGVPHLDPVLESKLRL